MADVFISYSRRDQAFVRALATDLEGRGKETWVDWDDIPPTADWLARIKAGIEQASAFVYVISPDSVASAVCDEEVAHATAMGKRIVPILLTPVAGGDTPRAISAHNWISFADGADFREAADTLVEAIETDLEWVEGHTRWLGRAREWEQGGRDASFLLRGAELAAAERWLEEGRGVDKDPAITPLHYDHILASRRATTSRARRLTGAVSVALLVAVGLAVLAFIQRSQAIDERERATARELVAVSALNLEKDPELSVALAARAARIRGGPETEQALRRALVGSFARATIPVRGGADAARISPDGARVLATAKGTARLYDVRSGRELHALRGSGDPEGIAFSADGRRVLTVGDAADRRVRVWDAASGRAVAELEAADEEGTISGAFSADGTQVVTAGPGGVARVYDTASGRRVGELGRGGRGLIEAAFDPSGERVVTGDAGGVVTVWDVSTRRGRVIGHHRDAVRARFTPDGSKVVALAGYDRAFVHRARDGRRLAALKGVPTVWRDFALGPDGRLAVTGGEDGRATVWRLRDGAVLQRLDGHLGTVVGAALSADGAVAATAGADGTVRVWEPGTGFELATLRGHRGSVRTVAFDRGGRRLVTTGADGDARVWQPGPPAVLGSERDIGLEKRAVSAAAFGPRDTLALGDDGGGAGVVASDGRRLAELPRLDGPVDNIAFAPGDRVAADADDAVVGRCTERAPPGHDDAPGPGRARDPGPARGRRCAHGRRRQRRRGPRRRPPPGQDRGGRGERRGDGAGRADGGGRHGRRGRPPRRGDR